MSATLLPLADHGNAVSALPFLIPMLLIVSGLAFLVIRDRLGRRATRRGNRAQGPS